MLYLHIHVQSILVSGENLCSQIRLSHIYRPPRLNNNNASIETFLKEISPYLDTLSKENQTQIISGDFNIDLKEIKRREKFQDYFDKFVSLGFLPKISLPTSFSTKTALLLIKFTVNSKTLIPDVSLVFLLQTYLTTFLV